MSLGQIITEGTMIAKLAMASPDTTLIEQKSMDTINSVKTEQGVVSKTPDYSKIANPFNINLESAICEPAGQLVNFQRVEIGNNDVKFKYDFNANSADVARIMANVGKDLNVALYKIGDSDGMDRFYAEAFKTLKVGKNSTVMLDGGLGFGKGIEPEYFAIANFKNDKVFFEGAIYESVSKLGDLDKSIYALAAVDLGHAYIGVGKNQNTLVALTGIKGFEDLGMLTFAQYNKETKGWNFISQVAADNVNQGFFSKETMDMVTEYFAVPAFFPLHFSPQVTKGKYSVKVNGNGLGKRSEIEMKMGYNNCLLPIAVGLNTSIQRVGEEEAMFNKTESGLVIEAYKPIKIADGIYGTIEAKYNARTNTFNAYLMLNFEQK